MKELAIKADRKVLQILTSYVRRWVEHKDFEKHKIDFLILAERWRVAALVVWALAIPAMLWAIQGKPIQGAIHVTIWGAMAAFEWYGIELTTKRMKIIHDWLFSMRETPAVYQGEKQRLEEMFESSRKMRCTQTLIMIGVTLSLFAVFTAVSEPGDPNNFVWQYLFVNTIANALLRYIPYVFNFDPPKKKKKASEAISEMLQKLWSELTAIYVPRPALQRI